MFTVKHRCAETGAEYLYSAERIEVIRKGDHFEDGIYLDREPVEPPTPENPQPTQTAKHIILLAGYQTEGAKARIGGKVWVMNESGATVAQYDL